MRRSAFAFAFAIVVAALAQPAHANAASSLHRRAAIVTAHTQHAAKARHLACVAPLPVCPAAPIGGAIVDGAEDVIKAGAGAASNAVMGGVVSWAAEGAAWLVSEVGKQIERSTRPELESGWFAARYAGMVQLAAALAAVFLLLAVGQAILSQDIWRLLRAAFISLPSGLLLTFAAVTLVEIGLALTDWMTTWVLSGTGNEVKSAFQGLGDVLSATNNTTLAPFVLFLSSLVVSLLSLLVWLELTMREASVYVAVAFLPLTLVAGVWERTAHWSRRLTEWLTAIVLAKFTIAAAFALAASAIVEAPKSGGGLSAVLAGCAVLLVAAVTPWALLQILPFAEAAAGRTLTRGSMTSAATAVPGAGTATAATRLLLLKNLGSAKAARVDAVSPTPSGPAPTKPPQRDAAPPAASLPTLPRERPTPPRGARR
jgi:hypothetical protein